MSGMRERGHLPVSSFQSREGGQVLFPKIGNPRLDVKVFSFNMVEFAEVQVESLSK